ncbi:hypothetical protein BCR43DRAFT_367989 [Syncephalastrum racemosum]|uniref:Secreted peptide n=1 Tax=Syncephalastrum racemosum TaxID=13706 RepID=A0A1X2H4C5_SYNRA|nr:hypothetical protein BCR43DRAFT_367989 [Syncephalastrum racemosum]
MSPMFIVYLFPFLVLLLLIHTFCVAVHLSLTTIAPPQQTEYLPFTGTTPIPCNVLPLWFCLVPSSSIRFCPFPILLRCLANDILPFIWVRPFYT